MQPKEHIHNSKVRSAKGTDAQDAQSNTLRGERQ